MSEQYPVYRTYGSDQSFQSQYDITPRPLRMEEEPDPSIGGWFNAVGDAIAMLPLYQSIYENTRVFEGDDPNYDPLSPSNLEGYEAFASEFIGIRSWLLMHGDVVDLGSDAARTQVCHQRGTVDPDLIERDQNRIEVPAAFAPCDALRGA